MLEQAILNSDLSNINKYFLLGTFRAMNAPDNMTSGLDCPEASEEEKVAYEQAAVSYFFCMNPEFAAKFEQEGLLDG